MKNIYHTAEEEQKTKRALLGKMVDPMFEGSASSMVMQLPKNKNTSKKELQAIKAILAKLDNDNK